MIEFGETHTEEEGVKFNPETREILERDLGLQIYQLSGRSIRKLRKDWNKLFQGRRLYNLDDTRSIKSEVAYSPQVFSSFPDSGNLTLQEQKQMLSRILSTIQKFAPEVDLRIGSVADYAELAHRYFGETGDYLFGKSSGYSRIRTSNLTGDGAIIDVGRFEPRTGLRLGLSTPEEKKPYLKVSPIIVPRFKFY